MCFCVWKKRTSAGYKKAFFDSYCIFNALILKIFKIKHLQILVIGTILLLFNFFFFLQTTIKVYARCLRPDIEYKTLSITYQTTCREVVDTLLGKYKMKHRDPRLFYLSMEVTVRKVGVRTQIALDEEARPAVLQSCHPRGDSRYMLFYRYFIV